MAEKHRKKLGNFRDANNELGSKTCSANNTDDGNTTLPEALGFNEVTFTVLDTGTCR